MWERGRTKQTKGDRETSSEQEMMIARKEVWSCVGNKIREEAKKSYERFVMREEKF